MLTGDEIRRLAIVAPTDGLRDEQVQPNGVDLTLDAAWHIEGSGTLGVAVADRHIPPRAPLQADAQGWLLLSVGAYGIRFREPVSIPLDCGGLAFPRSSLLRMGAQIPTAVWDAGYQGRAEALLVVHNPAGLRIQLGARIAQIVFFRLTTPTSPYGGTYQGENL
jgi:dUTP pyrophosphatase